MRPVNLLPPRYAPARASGERAGIGYAALGILAVLLVMIVAYVLTNNGINNAKEKTNEARAAQAAAEAKVAQLQAYGDFANLRVSRETAVASAAQLRFDYERLMRELALILPKDVYLTQFNAAPGGDAASSGTATAVGPQITLAGCAPNHPAVAATIVRLRKIHNVTDVTLASSTQQNGGGDTAGGGICKTQWNGTMTLEPEAAPTNTAPVPARLGGGP